MEDVIKIPYNNPEQKNLIILKLWRSFINNPTETEMSILANFLTNEKGIISSDERHRVRTKMNIEKFSFNNYVQKLKNRGLLYIDSDKIMRINNNILSLVKKNNFSIQLDELA